MTKTTNTLSVAMPDERLAFEAWQESEGGYETERGFGKQNDYQCDITRRMWEAWQARAALAATPAAASGEYQPIPVQLLPAFKKHADDAQALIGKIIEKQAASQAQADARERMTAGHASFFMERFLKEEKLLGPNEQAALHFVIDMLEAAPALVVLPEPDFYVRPSIAAYELPWQVCNGSASAEPAYLAATVRALLATGGQSQAVPDGWREQFETKVYADLAAADNQDVPLEEYPARILKVLDSIVGPRHPAVVQWRNDAIKTCIAIAYKYCRDPNSHKYLKQDLEALLTAEPAPQQADARAAKGEE